ATSARPSTEARSTGLQTSSAPDMEAAFEALRGALGRERLRLLAAVQYFTRLRVPGRIGHAQETLEGAIRYLPLIGAFVGAAVGVLMTLPYVRDEERSRAKPLVGGTSGASLVVAVVTGLAPLALVGKPALTGAGCVVAVGLLWRAWLRHRLGGYTGDCLGAA